MSGARNVEFERSMLSDAVELCQRAHGETPADYVAEVQHRLAIGAERYGDSHYLTKDNLSEAAEELPDFSAYLLLELQRLGGQLSEQDLSELRMYAVGAIANACHVHVALQRLRKHREEFLA